MKINDKPRRVNITFVFFKHACKKLINDNYHDATCEIIENIFHICIICGTGRNWRVLENTGAPFFSMSPISKTKRFLANIFYETSWPDKCRSNWLVLTAFVVSYNRFTKYSEQMKCKPVLRGTQIV